MAWIALTVTDVLSAMNATEMRAAQTFATENGQNDPVTDAITDVTQAIRGAIQSWPHNLLDQDATLIPPELKLTARPLLVAAIKARVSEGMPMTEDERKAADRAQTTLEKIMSGTLKVSAPANPFAAPSGQTVGGAQVVSARGRGHIETNGLF